MRTTTIQIARILRDALPPEDLGRLVEAIEGYLIENDRDEGVPNPTLVRRTDVAGDLLDRIETHLRDVPEVLDDASEIAARTRRAAGPAREESFTGYTAEEEEEADAADDGDGESR